MLQVGEDGTHRPYHSKQALNLTYSDLIDFEGLFEESSFELETENGMKDLRADAPWKNIKPSIVSLLASWEVSSVFDAIARKFITSSKVTSGPNEAKPGVQLRFSPPPSDEACRAAHAEGWTGNKPLENFEHFCSIPLRATDDSMVASKSSEFDHHSHVSLIPYMKSWMQGYGIQKYSVSLDPRFLQFQGDENELAVEPGM